MSKTYGYMRVSSVDQNEARQLMQLLEFGIERRNIYMDKQSGKDFARPSYQRLRKKLKASDLLVVGSIDRLGRNYRDIQEEWRFLTKERGCDIVILDMPILDTRSDRDLVGTLITDIVLQLLSYVAQVERENIRARQAEGIAAARQRGVHLGRHPEPLPEGFDEIVRRWETGALTPKQAVALSGMSPGRFYWNVKKYRKQQEREEQPPL